MPLTKVLFLSFHDNATGLFGGTRVAPVASSFLGFGDDGEVTTFSAADFATASGLSTHIADMGNPHGVTKAQVGLSSVGNFLAVNVSAVGAAGGVCPLDGSMKVPTANLPPIIGAEGAYVYQGTWNASTNVISPGSTPLPSAASGNKGWLFKVSVAGTTSIDGTAEWAVGDFIASNGTTWDKTDNTDAAVTASMAANVTFTGTTIISFAGYATFAMAAATMASGAVTNDFSIGGNLKAKVGNVNTIKIVGPNDADIVGGGVLAAIKITKGAGTNATASDFVDIGSGMFKVQADGSIAVTGNPALKEFATLKYAATTLIDLQHAKMNDTSGLLTIAFSDRHLQDNSNSKALDWQNRQLTDDSENPTVDWENCQLLQAGQYSLSWSSFVLVDSGGNLAVSWDSRTLVDGSAITSIDWSVRVLVNADNNTTIDYNQYWLYNDGGTVSVDFGSSLLKGGSGGTHTIIDWSGLVINDAGGTLAIDWGNKNLQAGSRAVAWGVRQLVNSSNDPTVKWEDQQLLDDSTLIMAWGTASIGGGIIIQDHVNTNSNLRFKVICEIGDNATDVVLFQNSGDALVGYTTGSAGVPVNTVDVSLAGLTGVFGGDGDSRVCGTPDAWIRVEFNGQHLVIPGYLYTP